MIGYNLDAVKKIFFDRQKVMDAASRATRRVLSKFGAFVRTRARSSIRKGKAPSLPGQPPTSRSGLLKKFIFFGYDATHASVVIGPILLSKERSPENKPIPQLLEEGGRAKLSTRFARRRKRKQFNLAPRPFMGPALRKELPGLPDMWRDSIR